MTSSRWALVTDAVVRDDSPWEFIERTAAHPAKPSAITDIAAATTGSAARLFDDPAKAGANGRAVFHPVPVSSS